MHLNDCELYLREVRGQRLAIIAGPRAVTAAEGAALLDQYFASCIGPQPVYTSPAGWQVLEPVPAAAPVGAEDEPTPKPKIKGKQP